MKSFKSSGTLSVEQHKKFKVVDSRPGIMVFVRKSIVDRRPSFRPILIAIGTPSCKIAKSVVPRMNSIISNEFTVNDTFSIEKEIVEHDSFFAVGTLDVDLLFTNTGFDKTIDICTNTIHNHQDVKERINKEEFRNLI